MKKRKKEEAKGPDQGWLMTYGDLMTLLVTFFVLMLTFSSIQISKFKKAMGSLRGALGVLEVDRGEKIVFKDFNYYDSMIQMEEEIEIFMEGIKQEDKAADAQLTEDKGLKIVLDNSILFEPGKAKLKPSVYNFLYKIGGIIKKSNSIYVLVEGHTDSIPIHTPEFESNWELSALRSLSVIKFFIDNLSINPSRLTAVGHGEYKPLVPNNSPQNRALNRRVELFINFKQLRDDG